MPGIRIPDEVYNRIQKEIEFWNNLGVKYYSSPTKFILDAIADYFESLLEERKKYE